MDALRIAASKPIKSTLLKACRSSEPRLQQRAQFGLVGVIQPGLALLGLQGVDALLQDLGVELCDRAEEFLASLRFLAGRGQGGEFLQRRQFFAISELFEQLADHAKSGGSITDERAILASIESLRDG